ncbi:hypothetical protein LCGC14_1220860 [marine sediment metagenome]|uniref:Uncharacterized protein n=1 Tax=marine sediment metagenome TaxID=412755 RepID=A0A0F9LFA4_9ZZZZ
METKEITTTGGHKAVIKSFITARDMRVLKDMYLAVAKFDGKGGEIFDVDVAKANEIENKTLELIVVSLDEKTEGLIEELLDLPAADYNEIFDAVQGIAGFDKKKEN